MTDLKTALSDAKNEPRNKVNVNLLTHLEYKRALYLVHKGYSVYAAKKQADQEIMTAFELPTTIKYSEDLSVFEDSEDDNVNYANASLMMLNLLFLGERNDAEIKAAIDSFIVDFETDGVWDDAETKAAMADYATEIGISGIRANVKAWNILSIPQFEDLLEMFWNNVYGLGGCSDKRKDVVAPNSNKLSKNYNKYFICNGSQWVAANTYQKDTYKWSAGKAGKFKKGNVTDTIYVYEDSKWKVAERETTIGLCGKSNVGEVSKYDGSYYICKNSAWDAATVLEYDTYGLKGVEGDVKAGVVNKNKYYVYENGVWRVAANDQEVALGVCTAVRESEVVEDRSTYYICKSKTWTVATALEYDTYGWKAGTEGDVRAGKVNADKHYVYENGAWRASANEIEDSLGACVTSREGEVGKSGNTYYICKSITWKTATTLEYDTYGWNAGTEGEVKVGNVNTDNYYIYKNDKWQTATSIEKDLGGCTIAREGVVGRSGSTYYICKLKAWTDATRLEYDTYGWEAGEEGEVKTGSVNTNYYYIYKNGEWQLATGAEIDLGGCTDIREGEVLQSGNVYYICKSKNWSKATSAEKDLGACAVNREGEVGKSGSTYYICKSKNWKTATALEYDTYGKVCLTDGSIVAGEVDVSRKYVCDAGVFRAARDLEITLDKGCVSYTKGLEIRIHYSATQDYIYVCNVNNGIASYARNIEFVGEYGTLTDARDNKTYKTVVIGSQTWMAENLNYSDSESYAGMKGRSWCYGGSDYNCTKYGRLYTWAVAMDSAGIFSTNGKNCGSGTTCSPTYPVRGICPEGWHLPDDTEWKTLSMMEYTPYALQAKGFERWPHATDFYGFSALPVGYYKGNDGVHVDFGSGAYFWSAIESGDKNAHRWTLYAINELESEARLTTGNRKYDGNSVRCIQD